MKYPLQGKGAIVTGGSRGCLVICSKHRKSRLLISILGIGAEIARELARQGASVLITYSRSAKAAQAVVDEINERNSTPGVKAKAVQADAVTALIAAETIVAEATTLFNGGIDIIVNNAANGDEVELADVTLETFNDFFHPNVLFPLLLIKLSKPVLRKRARVVNISSVAARIRAYPPPTKSHRRRLTYIQRIPRAYCMQPPKQLWKA